MGHELTVERVYQAGAEAVFDGFVGMYDEARPDWVTSARLDLRLGGRWEVSFAPPGVRPFREERVITELGRPHRLGYAAHIVADAAPDQAYDTTVSIEVRPLPNGTRLTLTQTGFPDDGVRDEFAAAWPDVLSLLEDRLST